MVPSLSIAPSFLDAPVPPIVISSSLLISAPTVLSRTPVPLVVIDPSGLLLLIRSVSVPALFPLVRVPELTVIAPLLSIVPRLSIVPVLDRIDPDSTSTVPASMSMSPLLAKLASRSRVPLVTKPPVLVKEASMLMVPLLSISPALLEPVAPIVII